MFVDYSYKSFFNCSLFSILIFILPSHRYPTSSYDFPFPAEISIYNKVRVYRPIPKQNRRCMQTCSDGLRFYIRTATERLLFFQRAEGKRVRNTINSVGEEGQRDHRNDEQAVPRRADEKEKRKDLSLIHI